MLEFVNDDSSPPKKGWICPKCGKVFGPDVTECYYCNDDWGQPWKPNDPWYPPTVTPWQPLSPVVTWSNR